MMITNFATYGIGIDMSRTSVDAAVPSVASVFLDALH